MTLIFYFCELFESSGKTKKQISLHAAHVYILYLMLKEQHGQRKTEDYFNLQPVHSDDRVDTKPGRRVPPRPAMVSGCRAVGGDRRPMRSR